MSADHDKKFVTTFLAVLGILVGIAFVCLVIARWIVADDPDDTMAPAKMARVQQHTQPVFAVVTDPNALQKVSAGGSEAAKRKPKSGSEVYDAVCSACHASGVAGAPKVGDKADWGKRLKEQGKDTLHMRAISGFKGMPAKGGSPDLSDAEVKSAVDHMLSETGL